ncbi:methionine--tRNA ligase [Persicirhabdus sediminis]|uniref:Methionine--tRNA ligase n=1 Tax=Persicirhabdus sediminis TaxID=454144 RepID=A0A8J7MEV2_9BACT|nr:methionine--tRNA ligase [Persicirhabdus sediminis]MBK1790549.1 methionine--tRNA ligase [Persicirhabdus sediminis]
MFFATTAIDYTNGAPHIGHAYEKVLTDVICRYRRLAGDEVFFLTGVDQHGQKVQQTAEKEGVNPATFCKKNTKKFLNLWKKLGLQYDGWAETIDARHKACVQTILNDLHDRGQLYKKAYKGFYSVRQEQFLTDKERGEDGEFGAEWGEVVEIEEENWYFKLSEHVAWLRQFVESNEDFIIPAFRRSEVLNAIERAEGNDLCISRPKSRLRWGIELPFDTDYVTYVWFDALINYISFAGYLAADDAELPEFEKLWPANIHVIGKDIMVPSHSIYWPIMLKAIGFTDEQMPQLLVHGWWNIKGEKMSKSLGNVVDPDVLADKFGTDALRYYLVRDIITGKDADFNLDRLITLYNTELANSLGNLCNRSLNMTKRFLGGELKSFEYDSDDCIALRESLTKSTADYHEAMQKYDTSAAMRAIYSHVSYCDGFAQRNAPWELAKHEDKQDQLAAVLYHMVESVAHISILLSPVLPECSAKIQSQLLKPELSELLLDQLKWGLMQAGDQTGKPKPVFPRIVVEELPAE